LTCEQHAAPRCIYCAAPILDAQGPAEQRGAGGGGAQGVEEGPQREGGATGPAAAASVQQLRTRIAAMGADASWCLERAELLFVHSRAAQVGDSWAPHGLVCVWRGGAFLLCGRSSDTAALHRARRGPRAAGRASAPELDGLPESCCAVAAFCRRSAHGNHLLCRLWPRPCPRLR
jgi:hypothetical protein